MKAQYCFTGRSELKEKLLLQGPPTVCAPSVYLLWIQHEFTVSFIKCLRAFTACVCDHFLNRVTSMSHTC